MRIAISKNSDNDFDSNVFFLFDDESLIHFLKEHVLMSHIPHPDNAKTGNPILKMVVDIPSQ